MTAAGSEAVAAGRALHDFAARLYPICRSLTGAGVRQTLAAIAEHIPLEIKRIGSGTPVLDWTVPDEWNVTDAYVASTSGARVIDFKQQTLHLVGYSEPVRRRVSRAELDAHLHSIPSHPDWIPYRTSYYSRTWGFCVSERQRAALTDHEYDVVVDATLEPGHLVWGECVLAGEIADEILVSCHVCHPSLANDNLSGIAVATFLARRLAKTSHRHTIRVLFVPGTIGSIAWLAENEAHVARVKHGLVLTCVGDPGPLTYKRSRRGTATIDRAATHVLERSESAFTVEDFSPWGYDERQFNSPGFDLPVGCLMRTPHGRFPEYHTSADDLSLIRPEALAHSLDTCAAILRVADRDARYVNLKPKGEPQLGKRGLYGSLGGVPDAAERQMAMLWTLNLSDGDHSLLDIATRARLPFEAIAHAADLLTNHGLLQRLED